MKVKEHMTEIEDKNGRKDLRKIKICEEIDPKNEYIIVKKDQNSYIKKESQRLHLPK